jgi:hypothetical protein
MMRHVVRILALAALTSIAGCAPPGGTDGGTDSGGLGGTGVDESRLGTPESSIAYQFELLKAGDTEKLKACFTDRLRDSVTADVVQKANQNIQDKGLTIDKLVGPVEMGQYEGKRTATIKMPGGGRTLTTLVETDGKWLAETIWFN